MHTRSIIALAGSLVIVASSVALFAHSMRPPAYDITLAPSVIDGRSVDNLAPVVVTADAHPTHSLSVLSNSAAHCNAPRALASLRQVMPYYSFAHSLASINKD